MIKINLNKKAKIVISLVVLVLVLGAAPFVIYLKALPAAVSNPAVISFVEKTLHKFAGLDLQIIHPELKTSLSPVIEFKVDELSLSNKGKSLLAVNNFDTRISFKEVFNKNIIANFEHRR